MKKRLILTFCIVAVVFSMIISLSISASSVSDVQIKCTVTSQIETSVVVDVSITSNPGFMYLELINNFPSELTLSSISNGSLISDLTKGTKYIWIADEDVIDTGTLCTLVFSIPEGTAPGNYLVSLSVGMCGNYDEQSVGVSISPCNITVECNHSFTKEDLSYLKNKATCTSPAVYYKSCVTCGAQGTETFEYGSTEPHSYTREVTTDTYKVSGATCTAKAVYNYCCATCDAKGTTTYESGTTLAHAYTRKVTTDTYKKSSATCTDAAVYYYCCATCDAKGTTTYTNGSELGHTGGTATCTAKAICTRCSQPYGNMLEHVYTAEDATDSYLKSAATCTSKAVYYKNCATCDKAGTDTFEYGTVKAHSYIEKVEDAYLKAGATCTSKAVYYKSCSACGVKGTETFEVGDAPSHNYQTAWSSDETSHWHECSKCGDKKDNASHTAGAAATESTAQTCTVCGYIITPELGHTHNYGSEWLSNATEHWHKCGGCSSTKDNAPHDYTNACDTDCNTCGYVRTITHSYKAEWSSNAEKHWYECSVCGDKSSEVNHIPGAEATETTDQVCTVCNFVMQEALGHTHNYNSSKNDETNHWTECACGEKAEVSQHTWNDGEITKEATVDEEGVKTYTCTVCGHSKDESIAKLPPQTDTPPTTDEPNENDGLSGGAIAGIVVGSTAVVGVGGFSLFWFVIKKKKFSDLLIIFKKK